MRKHRRKTISWTQPILSVIMLVALTAPALSDWDPGDDYKMLLPQLPDPNGLDVNFTYPKILAADWVCSESGPVSDIHFWFSSRQDQPFSIDNIHASIWLDQSGMPGSLLWEQDFGPGQFTERLYGSGNQGWYDPNTGQSDPNDHDQYYQINIEDIQQPCWQEESCIYWLGLSVNATGGPLGWKTSLDHWNWSAAWADLPDPSWQPLLYPPNPGEPLYLAFVITPEPATLVLIGLGAAAVLARRRWRR